MINRFFTDSYLYLYFSVATIFINFLFKDYINDKNIVVMLLFFVIFFGLPHGALDTLYAKKSNLYYNFISFITFNIVYLLVGVITFFLWLLFPLLCLFIFLVDGICWLITGSNCCIIDFGKFDKSKSTTSKKCRS